MLSKAPQYFPHHSGHYQMSPRLAPLGKDFGNGPKWESKVFQIDENYFKFLDSKAKIHENYLETHYCRRAKLSFDLWPICEWLMKQLSLEYPEYFKWNLEESTFENSLTGEKLHYSTEGNILKIQNPRHRFEYRDIFDALCMQIPEDIALTFLDPKTREDRLECLHVFSPSNWLPADKFDLSFREVHEPVPHMENIYKNLGPLLEAILHKGPYVRYAYTLTPHDSLNTFKKKNELKDLVLTSDKAELFLRSERQVLWGFPELSVFLFSIRIHFLNFKDIKKDQTMTEQIIADLLSMTPQTKVYKGLEAEIERIISWLRS